MLPASYIKHSFLNLHFQTPETSIYSKRYTQHKYDQLPCTDDLQQSLTLLLPHCVFVQEISYDGLLHQENLDEITKPAQAPFHTLHLRLNPLNFHVVGAGLLIRKGISGMIGMR